MLSASKRPCQTFTDHYSHHLVCFFHHRSGDWRDESFCSRNTRRRRTCLGVDLQMPRVLLFRILHLCSCLFLRTFASIALCCLVPASLRALRMHHPSSCLLLLAASLRFACRASLNAFKTSALDFDYQMRTHSPPNLTSPFICIPEIKRGVASIHTVSPWPPYPYQAHVLAHLPEGAGIYRL